MTTPVHHWITSAPTILGPKRNNDIDMPLKAHLLTKNISIDDINPSNINEIAEIMAENELWYSLTSKIIYNPKLSKCKLHSVKENGRELSDNIKELFGVYPEHPHSLTVMDKEGCHYALEYIWVRLSVREEESISETDVEEEEEMIEEEGEDLFEDYEVFQDDEYEFRR